VSYIEKVIIWRKLYNEEIQNFYSSPNIEVIRSRWKRGAGHVRRMRKVRNTNENFV
jgi:hypothetical protein